jgi:Tol biopolymer transport system component
VFDLGGREVVAVPGYDDAAWTPDGKLIATGALTGPGLFEIDPRTKDVRAIDAKIGAPYQPSVSPDGRTIAFVTGDRVWLIERDGTDLRQLLPHGMKQQRPEFSPDGRMVAAVICNQLGNDMTGEVFVVDRKTQEVTTLRTSTGLGLLPDTSTRLGWRR